MIRVAESLRVSASQPPYKNKDICDVGQQSFNSLYKHPKRICFCTIKDQLLTQPVRNKKCLPSCPASIPIFICFLFSPRISYSQTQDYITSTWVPGKNIITASDQLPFLKKRVPFPE